MNKSAQLAKNTIIIAIGKIATQLIPFFLLPVYTAFLSPGEYGTIDLILTYISLCIPVMTLQLEMATFRFVVDARNDHKKIQQIVSSVIWTALPIAAVALVSFAVFSLFLHIPYSGLIMLNIAAMLFSSIFLQFARGIGDNKKFAIAGILSGLTTAVGATIFIIFLGLGAGGILLATAIANSLCATYLTLSLGIHKKISWKRKSSTTTRELLRYSLPLIPNGVSWWVISASNRTIISIFIDLAANGIYAIANKFSVIFSGLVGIFNLGWTESASLHINSRDRDKFFSNVSETAIRFFGCLGLLMIAGIPLVFRFLVGDEFSEAYYYIPILVVGAFFNSIVSIYSAIYVAKKLTKQVMNTSLFAAIISIGVNLILIQFIGLYAAAIATAAAFLAMAVFRHYDMKKHVNIHLDWRIFTTLSILFFTTITLYYLNHPVINIASLLLAITASIFFNLSLIKKLSNLAKSSLRKQPPK
jgi:O-antigen/teichoic acid export membrane protein